MNTSDYQIPYSGEASLLLEMPEEEMRAAIEKDYRETFDPLLQLEVDLPSLLSHYGGHVTEEMAGDLGHRIHSMNDLYGEKQFLPENIASLEWDEVESCEDFVYQNLNEWPESFVESSEPFFTSEVQGNLLEVSAFTIPWDGEEEGDRKLKLTCREYLESEGGTFDESYDLVLYYHEYGHLYEALLFDTEVTFDDGLIFKVVNFEKGTAWGASFESNQLAVPRIEYFY